MALERVPESRVLIESEGSDTVVTMPAARQWFTILFLPVWLVGWFWGEVSVFREIASSSRPINGFLLAWVAVWTVGGALTIGTLVWQVFGVERLRLQPGRVILEYRVWRVGRRREFDPTHVERWRVVTPVASRWYQQNQMALFGYGGGGTVAFDYGVATVYCGQGLDEADARQLLERLRARGRLPAAARST